MMGILAFTFSSFVCLLIGASALAQDDESGHTTRQVESGRMELYEPSTVFAPQSETKNKMVMRQR